MSPRVHGMVKMGQVGHKAPKPRSLPFGGTKPQKAKASKKRPSGIAGVYPVQTTIVLPQSLSFMWKRPLGFNEPVVVVEGEGISRISIDVAPKTATEVSATAKGLGLKQGGTYSWYIASRGDKPGRGRSTRFPFWTLSDTKKAQLEKDLARIDDTAETPEGRKFLKGQLYFNYGMNYDMVQTLLPLWKTNKSPAIKKLLKLGYARMGQIEEARKYK